jgi:hypothetical protein
MVIKIKHVSLYLEHSFLSINVYKEGKYKHDNLFIDPQKINWGDQKFLLNDFEACMQDETPYI